MEFTLKITLDATPALLNVLNKMFGIDAAPAKTAEPVTSPTPAAPKEPVKKETPVRSIKKDPAKPAATPAVDPDDDAEMKALFGDDEPTAEETDNGEEKIDLEVIRTIAVPLTQDPKKRPLLKKLMDKYKITALSGLEPKQFKAFHDEIKQIAA